MPPTPARPTRAGPQAVLPSQHRWPLFDSAASRRIEQASSASHAPHALMARAGLGLARLALALAPQARRVWVAAGPGNNGGDGLVAARLLHQQGWVVRVSLLGDASRLPDDAAHALAEAHAAGVPITTGLDRSTNDAPDLAIDALLGLGSGRAPEGAIAEAVRQLNASRAPVLAVDLPTGLCGDTGRRLGDAAVLARHTLALLTLKPGLFTAQGRDHAGRVWFDDLGVDSTAEPVTLALAGPETLQTLLPGRAHAQHKGSFGVVLVRGGAAGMGGAALLAARAALAAGAGRVYLARLDGDAAPDPQRPELMPRTLQAALAPALLGQTTVVCGCGGGEAVRALLPAVLAGAARLVLDADALNAVAADSALSARLLARAAAGLPTVLTPHPLEAARLLAVDTLALQADRIGAARQLAGRTRCTVVLKGSGSVIAAADGALWINPTGNARLGSAGTGDVLAGWLGGLWSQHAASAGLEAAIATVWLHGHAAEGADLRGPLLAADLVALMAASLP
ncbi:MAG: NAD(P)H-hydrate dehydratase [Microbacteriaceae bacterium]|nr:NAD(P)H-hydrate dehydratase [Burkholderiaceae bacterium]